MQKATPPTNNQHNDVVGAHAPTISLSSNREAPSPPAPSACDQIMNSLSSNTEKYKAPNIILDWNDLKNLIDENLGPCKICKSNDRTLVKKKGISYACTVGIHCNDCEKKKKEIYQSTNYESKTIEKMEMKTKQQRDKKRKAQLSRNHLQRQLNKINALTNTSSVLKTKINKYVVNNALHYQLNICAILLAFYLGTGGYDVGSIACFFGIPGGRGWERTFHHHSGRIHEVIMGVFEDEVIAMIKEKMKDNYSNDEIDELVKKYERKQFDDLPEETKKLALL